MIHRLVLHVQHIHRHSFIRILDTRAFDRILSETHTSFALEVRYRHFCWLCSLRPPVSSFKSYHYPFFLLFLVLFFCTSKDTKVHCTRITAGERTYIAAVERKCSRATVLSMVYEEGGGGFTRNFRLALDPRCRCITLLRPVLDE